MEKPPRAFESPRGDRPASAEPTEGEMRDPHDPYAAFRFRAYRYFVTGNCASVVGRQMLSLAVEWEVYQRTHSAAALGFVGLTLALPTILFALPAGHLADRFSRRGILLVAQMVIAATSVGLAVLSLSHGNLRILFVLLFVAGTARAFGWAARGALLANLVPPAHFGSAVTWNSSLFQISSVAGPACAGFLIARYGFPFVYIVSGILALVFFALLLPIHVTQEKEEKPANGLRSLFSGLRFVWETKIVLATITLDLFAVLFGGATALLPIFADRILRCGPVGLGWLRAAPSVGSFAMGLAIAHLPPMRRAGPTLLWAVAGFGVSTIIFGFSTWMPLSLLMLLFTGVFDSVSVVVRHTLVQLLTPDAMRGRVSAVNNVFIGSSNELGAFESGMTAAWFGPVASVVGGGLATIAVVLGVTALWPQVARIKRLQDARPEN